MVRSTRITVRLPLTQFRVLEKRADEENKSLSEIVRDSLQSIGIEARNESYFTTIGNNIHYNKLCSKGHNEYLYVNHTGYTPYR